MTEDTSPSEPTELETTSQPPPTPPAPPQPVPAGPAAGWYPDAHNAGQEQYWDGSAWTDQRRQIGAGALTADYRRTALNAEVQRQVTAGNKIESQSDFQVVLVSGKPVNHVLHLLLTIFTLGLWLIPWIILGLTGGEHRKMVTVNDQGVVDVRKIS